MKPDGFTYYFSGLENGIEKTEKFFEAGKKIKGGMMSYMTFRGQKKYGDFLVRFRKQYGGKVMIDSGAHAFISMENIASGTMTDVWHPQNKQVGKWGPEEIEKYAHDYMDWLEANRDAYDWAVELDIQKSVGQDKVDAWREEFIARKIPIVIVLHPRAGDTIEVVRKWKAKGVTYFGRGEFDKKDMRDMTQLREMNAEGVKVHIFAFSPQDLGKYLDLVDSTDSSSWLSPGLVATLVTAKGRTYETTEIKSGPILTKVAMNRVSEVLDKKEVDDSIARKTYLILSWYNMFELQKWIDSLTYKPAYTAQLDRAERGETKLPDWVKDKDKFGRPKSIYLQSRFNNYRSGVYAREIQKNALECNTCAVRNVCPVFEAGSLCYFTPYWKRLGKSTRNKEQIINVLAELIGDKYERLERGKYFEAKLGEGQLDKSVSQLEMDLAKTLELMDKVVYGNQQGTKVNMMPGSQAIIGVNLNTALEELRTEYGDPIANKIRRRIEKPVEIVEAKVIEEEHDG
jgi:hypothetical protein